MPDFGDYFDLLAREVARADAHTAELRQKIYERARKLQLLQLQSVDRSIAEFEIARECDALERAIRRVESLAVEQPSIIGTWKMLLATGGLEVWDGPEELETPVGFWQKLLKASRRLELSVLTRIAEPDMASAKSTLLASWRGLQQWTRRMFE